MGENNFLPLHQLLHITHYIFERPTFLPISEAQFIKDGVDRYNVSRESEGKSFEIITGSKLGPQRFCMGNIILLFSGALGEKGSR